MLEVRPAAWYKGEWRTRFDLTAFLLSAFVISLSGVLAPGPMTAATLAAGTRNRHAGALIALGHAVVEFPLMLAILAGAGKILESPDVKIAVGAAGGAVLLLMGVQLLIGSSKAADIPDASTHRNPFTTGIILTAANPYFILWWATIGLALTTRAVEFGIVAFALFTVVHWLCDLVFLEAISVASFKGSELLGRRSQQIVLAVCGVALLVFGCMFVYDAATDFLGRSTMPQ